MSVAAVRRLAGAARRRASREAERRRWLVPAALLVTTFALFAVTAGAASLDVRSANFAAWKVATTGDRTFEAQDWPAFDAHPLRHVWIVENDDGTEAVGRSSGVVAASVPAYVLTRPAEFTDTPANLTAALLAALAVVLLYLTLVRHLPRRWALGASLAFGVGTPVWSVAADGMWPHTLTVLGITGMAWAADRNRWLLVGLFGGVALWGRLHASIICAVLGLGVALARRDPRIALRAGAASAGMLALSSAWTRWFYGTWDPTAGYSTDTFSDYAATNRFDLLNHLGFWVAPDRGMLVWTPLLLLLLPALRRQWRELPDWSRHLLVGGLVYLLVQGVLNRYSGGSTFFPYRLGLETLACLTPALALSAPRMGPVARRVLPHVLIAQTALIAAGAIGLLVMPEVDSARNELLLMGATSGVLLVVCVGTYLLARGALARERAAAGRSA